MTQVTEPLSFTAEAIRERLNDAEQQELALIASDSGIADVPLLFKELSLHLPRFASGQAASPRVVLEEARRLASRLSALQRPYLTCIPTVPASTVPTGLLFSATSEEVAQAIHEAFHYLLSFRDNSIHFGLSSSSNCWPIAMCSLSTFDLFNMEAALGDIGFSTDTAFVLSRVFAFPGAPRNSITFLLGKIRQWIRTHHPGRQVLLTYVNPNIGFSGLSYQADNWSQLGREQARYKYYEGNYITERDISRRQLQGDPGVTQSQCELQPLSVLIRRVNRPDSPAARIALFDPWLPGGIR